MKLTLFTNCVLQGNDFYLYISISIYSPHWLQNPLLLIFAFYYFVKITWNLHWGYIIMIFTYVINNLHIYPQAKAKTCLSLFGLWKSFLAGRIDKVFWKVRKIFDNFRGPLHIVLLYLGLSNFDKIMNLDTHLTMELSSRYAIFSALTKDICFYCLWWYL